VYKPSFSCKINCTKVKQTATKLHKSPDETDRSRSQGLFPTPTPHPDCCFWWWCQ